MSFGFSVGDFIAALELVGTVVNALRASGDASKEFREVVQLLTNLHTALLAVEELDFEDAPHLQYPLQSVASQCQQTIQAFCDKVQKYNPHLGEQSPTYTVRGEG